MSESWPPLIVTLLLFNITLLATSSYNQPSEWGKVINILDAICVIIYVIEMGMRIMAAGRFRCVVPLSANGSKHNETLGAMRLPSL